MERSKNPVELQEKAHCLCWGLTCTVQTAFRTSWSKHGIKILVVDYWHIHWRHCLNTLQCLRVQHQMNAIITKSNVQVLSVVLLMPFYPPEALTALDQWFLAKWIALGSQEVLPVSSHRCMLLGFKVELVTKAVRRLLNSWSCFELACVQGVKYWEQTLTDIQLHDVPHCYTSWVRCRRTSFLFYQEISCISFAPCISK